MQHAHRQVEAYHDTDYWKRVLETLSRFSRLGTVEIYDQWCGTMLEQMETFRDPLYGNILREASPLARSWDVLHLRPFRWCHNLNTHTTSDGSWEFNMMNYFLQGFPNRIRD